ncbi:hypothetical protein GQX73_g5222 [Xylaria multiplex]|uniref:Uncharacterized protein n=1 Tax=Xylaria multiplex TaxID=323545 RepID=A0A7C8INN6_9PEZI|nr:hypothetical protein GQX73_g5222 [Xylaria multiplex]
MDPAPPFKREDELCGELEINNTPAETTLPGDPRISLTDPEIHKSLEDELITEQLNKLAPHFWLITTQSSDNILSLTEQAVQGREITITENPGLHLVWLHRRIFIKPLPKYLMSYAFWKHYLCSDNPDIAKDKQMKLFKAAQGFIRSYAYLIRHESDFRMATDEKKRLIPEGISYTSFAHFIDACKEVGDDDVSPRYKVGELRLKRLNFWNKVFFHGSYYRVKWQYSEYFAQFYAPLLFAFALFSLLTSSMQLVLAVPMVLQLDTSWFMFARAAWGLGLFIIFLVASLIAFLLITLVSLVGAEIGYALRDLYLSSREKQAPRDQEYQTGQPGSKPQPEYTP